jgi:hypothetical protein
MNCVISVVGCSGTLQVYDAQPRRCVHIHQAGHGCKLKAGAATLVTRSPGRRPTTRPGCPRTGFHLSDYAAVRRSERGSVTSSPL